MTTRPEKPAAVGPARAGPPARPGSATFLAAVTFFAVLAVVFSIPAVSFWSRAGDEIRDAWLLEQRGETATATVVALSSGYRVERTTDVAYPGPLPTGEATVAGWHGPVGMSVLVTYDPLDPRRAAVADEGVGWGSAVLTTVFALGMSVIPLGSAAMVIVIVVKHVRSRPSGLPR